MSNQRTVQLNVIADGSKAAKVLDDTASKAEKSSGRFGKAFTGLGSVLGTVTGGALGPLTEHLEAARQAMERMGEGGNKVGGLMMKFGAGIAAVGAGLTAMGDKDKAATQQLKASVEAAGQSYDDFDKSVEGVIKHQEQFGHKATDTTDALRILTQANGDMNVSMKEMGVVADLAAAKHISLADAAGVLAKVHGGATKVLKSFGIVAVKAGDNLKQMTAATKATEAADAAETKAKEALVMMHERLAGKTKLTVSEQQGLTKATEAVTAATDKATAAHKKSDGELHTVTTAADAATVNIQKLGEKLGGQASAAAKTFSGHLKAIKTELEDGAAKMGQKYGPALTGLGSAAALTGSLVKGGAAIFQHFTAVQETMTGATEAESVAMDGAAVSEGLALAPILLIIAAVALLAIGIYELATHWKTVWKWIKEAVSDAWDFITGIFTGAIDWVKTHWKVILEILGGPFIALPLLVSDHFQQIMRFLSGIPGDVQRIADTIAKALANSFLWGINNIIGAWNWLMGMLKIPGFDVGPIHFGGLDLGGALKIGAIPYLADGGIVTSQTLAMLGEGGKREAVVPLDRAGEFGFGGNGGGGDVHVTIPLSIDGRVFARATAKYTRAEWNRMSLGSTTLPTQ